MRPSDRIFQVPASTEGTSAASNGRASCSGVKYVRNALASPENSRFWGRRLGSSTAGSMENAITSSLEDLDSATSTGSWLAPFDPGFWAGGPHATATAIAAA